MWSGGRGVLHGSYAEMTRVTELVERYFVFNTVAINWELHE